MKVRTIMVLGLFWIFVLSLVSVSAVAADGLYWGDCVTDPTQEVPVVDPPFVDSVLKDKVKKDKIDKIDISPIIEPIVLKGLYWGD